jgi:hypothetical protein
MLRNLEAGPAFDGPDTPDGGRGHTTPTARVPGRHLPSFDGWPGRSAGGPGEKAAALAAALPSARTAVVPRGGRGSRVGPVVIPLPGAVVRPVVGAPTRPVVGRPDLVVFVGLAPVFGRRGHRAGKQPHPQGRCDHPLLAVRPKEDLEIKGPAVNIVRWGNGQG